MGLAMSSMANALLAWMALTMPGMAAGTDAETVEVDKGVFNLFNPTPAQYLRAMDTDGPGSTESPYTVDAGHFQIEMTLAGYTYDRESFNGVTERVEAWSIAPMNLKIGLLNQLDAQLLLEPYTALHERVDRSGGTQPGSRTTTLRGFGDTTVRLKYNFWGNDGGRTAFAATPYVKFPTSQEDIGNREIEGGLVLPLAVELPRAFYLGVTTRFDAVRDKDESGYHPEFLNSIALGHKLFGNLFGYVEFFSAVSTERDSEWMGTFDTGVIYEVTRNVQLNTGVNIGVTGSADDWNAFLGLAWRF